MNVGSRSCHRIRDDFFGQFYSTLAHQKQLTPVKLYRATLILKKYDGFSDQRVIASIIDRIGNTSLIELRRTVPDGCARILVKIESENPTGSMKDRMALAMIEKAEADGRLQPGGQFIEYTDGSTGGSLAFICAVKRYTASIVT